MRVLYNDEYVKIVCNEEHRDDIIPMLHMFLGTLDISEEVDGITFSTSDTTRCANWLSYELGERYDISVPIVRKNVV